MTEENLNPEEIVAEVEEIQAPAEAPIAEPLAEPVVEEAAAAAAAAAEAAEAADEAEAPKPAPVPAPKPVKPVQKYAAPVAVTLDDIENSKPTPAGPAVVSNNDVDDVVLAKIVYKNLYARKSLSVHHVQRRLIELGYAEAGKDKDGYYGDHTKTAVARFQKENKLEGEGMTDARTLILLFTGDPNVNVVI
jgi:peptidoglycan hydrolase-like protein with peptidoglycan-binding domain